MAIANRSRTAHVEYGCEHMHDMLKNARKPTLQHYRNILQKIHDEPSIIAQTSKGDGRAVVSLRPLYLCLQCPVISTEAERDQHVEAKSHCFGGFESTTVRGRRLTYL
jgi:ubiquitin carboxyl-terminal hydrolase 22/27/51